MPPPSTVRACAAKLGVRRQFFGTDDVVADMEALRKALGVDKWTLDGISYGTYVGERYALAHPEHVSRLVPDSVVAHVGLSDLGVVESGQSVQSHAVSDRGRQAVASFLLG